MYIVLMKNICTYIMIFVFYASSTAAQMSSIEYHNTGVRTGSKMSSKEFNELASGRMKYSKGVSQTGSSSAPTNYEGSITSTFSGFYVESDKRRSKKKARPIKTGVSFSNMVLKLQKTR